MNATIVPLGQIVVTRNAMARLTQEDIQSALNRHAIGDWCELDEEDRLENDQSLQHGLQLLSAYTSKDGTTFWIITEADRNSTCILLPEDY